jgi:hypothetical protein
MSKEDPLKLYKIEIALELVKLFWNGRLVKLMFFPEIYVEKEQFAGAKNDSHAEISWTFYLG